MLESKNDIQNRRVHSVGSNVANSIRLALFVGSEFFDSIGHIVECRIFDIRSTLLRIGFFRFDRPHSRMSNIRHPKHPSSDRFFSIRSAVKSNIEYSTSEEPFFVSDFFDSIGRIVECRIFDIRSTLLRIGFFRFQRPSVECQIFDIRSASIRILNIQWAQDVVWNF